MGNKNIYYTLTVLAFVLTIGFCSSTFASGTVTLNASYLDKELCWIEAGKHLNTGYSRGRIAIEIYAHAVADNMSYKYLSSIIGSYSLLAKFVNTHAHVVNIGGDSSLMVSLYRKLWKMIPSSVNHSYVIHNRLNYNKVIDVKGNKEKNGTILQLYTHIYYNPAQKFELFSNGDGTFSILKEHTFMAVGVCNGVGGNGVFTQLYTYNGAKAQKWRLYRAYTSNSSEFYYYIRNELGYYLDVCNASAKNGTRLWVYSLNHTNAQKWGFSVS